MSPTNRYSSRSRSVAEVLSLEGLDRCAIVARFHAGQEIGRQNEPSEYWHHVLAGAVRQYAVQPDGRRQIIDLLLPGDWFGFITPDGECFAAQAIVQGTVLASYPRRKLESIAETNFEIARSARELVLEAMSRLQRQLLVLGRVTASEKVGAFLLEMSSRLVNEQEDRFVLPLSRYDIADYVATSVETVSRSLTELRRRGLIALTGPRELKILDRQSLRDRLPARTGLASASGARAPSDFNNTDYPASSRLS